ncbi:aldose 1-epimerase [Ferruginibacter paludis]|uniref:aldose 1-epimerase n=1 Tax=Ferruginibacter paludis TaxID=1310417 RepID=UPI0025B5A815|nr:aldose 1-epimerase [Ferruginibacter paludis]MDN3658324.1 aldose 1-epimerase [Ferruginibacter paludis]
MSFTVESKTENGFDKIILKDNSSNTSAEIIPRCGAILHAFSIWHNHHFINVIDQYDSAEDFAANVESKGMKSCKLSPFACRIKNAKYSFGGHQYTFNKYMLGDNAIHGLLYDVAFEIIDQEGNDERAQVVLQYDYKGENAGFPFSYVCNITYTLSKENTLEIATKITNTDKGIIPMQDGWHPYFKLGKKVDELQLEFQSKEKIIFDDTLVPNGETEPYQEFGSLKQIGDTFFDNCFTSNFAECQPLCVLRDPVQKLQVEIHPDKSYPYLQIYTPPHRNSIAIENLSAVPDAFNNGIGLITLAPQTSQVFATTFKITPLN